MENLEEMSFTDLLAWEKWIDSHLESYQHENDLQPGEEQAKKYWLDALSTLHGEITRRENHLFGRFQLK